MKIACDKCLRVEDPDRIKGWLKVKTTYTEYTLCPECKQGFWMAVDNQLPAIVQQETDK